MTGERGERLDGDATRRWMGRAVDALDRARADINSLNVFPVPDRDTGTNMLVTVRSAAAASAETAGPSPVEAADAAAAGALSGALGSSGVILAGYLRGFAEALRGRVDADGVALAAALGGAAEAAYAAVSAPLEGTILSVARAAAVAAVRHGSVSVATSAGTAAAAARAELAGTTALIPALAAANVVDAGGQGLVVLLDALADVTAGVTAPTAATRVAGAGVATLPAELPFAYEVQYVLEAPAHVLATLRVRLEQIGDSVAVVAGTHRHSVHVHVNDVGAAIEAALDVGRPSRIRVTNFAEQIFRAE